MKPCRVCRQNPRQPGLALCKPCASAKKKEKERIRKLKAAQRKEKERQKPSQEKADALFQMYIRRRDFGESGGRCFICGEYTPFKGSQPMHFISRSCQQLRWDEGNCFGGCAVCNVYKKGNYPAYTLEMQRKFGVEKVAEMVATKWQTDGRPAAIRQMEAIEKYERLLKEMGRDSNWKSKTFGEKTQAI
jgi:hypothetical protein